MKSLILAIVACCAASSVATAIAAPDYPSAGNPSNKLVESIDTGGGGSVAGTHGAAPTASAGHAASTSREAAVSTDNDPSAPVTATPRRPTYRWQSLVPGAIK